jgi:hypothetical protein
VVQKLLRCTQCNQVIPQFDPFLDFGESSSLPGVEWSSGDLDEQKEFFKRHLGHQLEELSIDPETFISDKPAYELMKVSYVEASNGQQRFLIKRSRESLNQPVSYELIPGKIQVADVSLEIQEADLRRQISWLNGSFPLSGEKVNKFIQAFREEVKSISPESLHEELESTLPGETPLLTYGSFSEDRWKKVLHRCENAFEPPELELVEGFIRDNRQPGEVLGLKIRKAVSFTQ